MAALSDQLLAVTIIVYLVAMAGHAVEYALANRSPRRGLLLLRRATQPAADRRHIPPQETVQAGAATPDPEAGRDVRRVLGLITQVVLVAAVVTHLATVVTRALAAERLPWGNMYEYLLTTTWVGVVAWLWLQWRYPAARHLGLYVALVNALLLGLAGMVVYTPVGPLQPALDSYWFVIHVAAAATASGVFLVGFVTAVMYLVRAGYDRGDRRFPYPVGGRLPGAEILERLSFRLHAFGFPIWTFAVIAGAIWAEASWGRFWGWDPKEVWAFITWVVYAAYLHARATTSVRRTVVAWLAIIGWLTMLMNLFGVNLFFEGLHSYA